MLDSTCENSSKTVYARHDIIHSKKGKSSLYFIFTPNMIRYLQNEQHEIVQYFVDTTFRIVPAKFKPYKLHVIIGFNKKFKQTVLCLLILYEFMDIETYSHIYKILKCEYKFKPVIVCSDFQRANIAALNAIYKNKIGIVTCFFHFQQAIKKN